MFKFFGFGRKKSSDSAPASQTPEPQNLTQQHTDIQRELVRVVLKDTLRMHGIPAGWIGCEVTVMSRRSQSEDMFVHLIINKWHEALLRHAPALQQQLIEGLNRFEPNVDHSKYIVSWRFSPACECPITRMPDPRFWNDEAAAPKANTVAPVVAPPFVEPAPKPKFDLPPSSMDKLPSAYAPTEPSPLR
jgi:hypothetical protein